MVLTIFGNKLTFFGRWVYYISFRSVFQGECNGAYHIWDELTFFGRWMYYIAHSDSFFKGNAMVLTYISWNEANLFWKMGVLYIIQIHFSRRMQWCLPYLGFS